MSLNSWRYLLYGAGRGGNGRNADGTWPPTDGKGCPLCGATRNGGHGGGCPNTMQYDEKGNTIP